MEQIKYWKNFFNQWYRWGNKQIQKEKDRFIKSVDWLRTLSIQNKEWFKQVFLEAQKGPK